MEINNDSTEKKILVSNEFFEIYKSFNVCSQVEKMIKLSRRELYLLLTVCIDNHDDSVLSVRHNSNYFRDEILEILEIQVKMGRLVQLGLLDHLALLEEMVIMAQLE